MKKLLLLTFLLIAGTGVNTLLSQEIKLQDKPGFKGDRPISVEVSKKYVPLYVISDKELPSYFVSGEIPVSFPKYDGSLSKKQNEIIALKWGNIPENKALLTESAQKLVDDKTKEYKQKYK